MSEQSRSASADTSAPDSEAPDSSASLSGISELMRGYVAWLSQVAGVAETEARLIMLRAARVLTLTIVLAVMLVSGWLALMATLVVLTWQLGIPLPLTLLGLALICFAAVWGLRWLLVRELRKLNFNQTRALIFSNPEADSHE
ncbi:hypothetical protein [Marinobacterium mangrovicola]|uniref:Membrane protein YqjE n=1 Tax=Marinobacterium mangrovicola TaxID=1476959 RepID=A0A4R1GCU4_9GAMM|nr:hypothetical protein [Marinobacterium mangrovicola]TCK05874.1 hypothetical protein CLV83_2815 [Marinobacterium mangrovicola]